MTLTPTRWTAIPALLALAVLTGCQGFSTGKSADVAPITGQVTATPNSLTFTNVQTGTNQSQFVQLTNGGSSSVTVTQAAVAGAGLSVTGLSLPATIAAGQSATLQVVFSPTATGGVAGSVSLSIDGLSDPLVISVTGTAISQASVSTSPTSFNFGNVPVGSEPKQVETVTNTGSGTVTITSVGATGNFAANGPTMPVTLSPNQSAKFNVFFGPNKTGATTGTLAITVQGLSQPIDLSLSGTGVAGGTLSPSPSSFSFTGVQVGQSQTQTETLTNSGGSNVDVSGVTASGTGFSVSGFSAATLGPGQTTSFSVKFAPTASGTFNGSVVVTSDGSNPALTLGLSGTAVAAPSLATSPASFSFPNVVVGQTSSQTETLKNNGGANVDVSAVTASGTGFSVSGFSATTLTPGQTTTFNVNYAPQSAGSSSGTVTVTSDGTNPSISISLSGTAVAPATITATPSSFTFTNVTVGQNSIQTETLKNTGGVSANISSVTTTGTGFSTSGITPPVTLGAGQSVSFNVIFTPASAGSFTGNIAVASNATNPSLNIGLSGSSVAAAQNTLSATGTVAVGSVVVGTNGTATGTLTASGGNVSVSSVTLGGSNPAEFSITGISFPVTVAPGTPVSFTVKFTPAATGSASATASFASNASNSPAVTSLTGTGSPAPVHTVKLTWTASTTSGITSYNIYRAPMANGSCGTFAVYDSASGSATTYTDQTVTDGNGYCYGTTAVDSNGESTMSNQVQISIPAP